jgi:hypothetical protein
MGMLEARSGEPEVVQSVIKLFAGDGDPEGSHVGKV